MHSSVSSPLPPPITGVNSRENYSGNSVKNIFHSILSYNDNIMLAAVISLLLVVLFVLLLHVYARWFLTQSRHRSGSGSVAVPRRRFHTFHVDSTFPDSPEKRGLEKSAISAIPLFVYRGKGDENDDVGNGLECSICLSSFENGDVGRKLPKCSHAFHAECIEMWLFSHSSCPVCRAPVVCGGTSLGFNSVVSGGGTEHVDGGGGRSSGATTSLEVIVELAPKRDSTENGVAAEDNSLPVSTSFTPSSSAGGLT